jgi:hypothetical protein
MAMGRAVGVYASESKNRQISNQLQINEFGGSTAQVSLIKADSAEEFAQSLMTTGLAYMASAMRKLSQRVRKSVFNTNDATIGTVLELLV